VDSEAPLPAGEQIRHEMHAQVKLAGRIKGVRKNQRGQEESKGRKNQRGGRIKGEEESKGRKNQRGGRIKGKNQRGHPLFPCNPLPDPAGRLAMRGNCAAKTGCRRPSAEPGERLDGRPVKVVAVVLQAFQQKREGALRALGPAGDLLRCASIRQTGSRGDSIRRAELRVRRADGDKAGWGLPAARREGGVFESADRASSLLRTLATEIARSHQ